MFDETCYWGAIAVECYAAESVSLYRRIGIYMRLTDDDLVIIIPDDYSSFGVAYSLLAFKNLHINY